MISVLGRGDALVALLVIKLFCLGCPNDILVFNPSPPPLSEVSHSLPPSWVHKRFIGVCSRLDKTLLPTCCEVNYFTSCSDFIVFSTNRLCLFMDLYSI